MTEPYYSDFGVTVHAGDCLEVLAGLPDASVHSVVTDPPYGLRFMGASWDGADIEAGVELRRSQAAMPDDGKAGANGGYRSAAAEAGRYDLSANAAFGEWCRAWATVCLRVLKPGGHLLAFGGSRTWHRLAVAVEDAGFEVRDSIAWLYATGFPKSLDVSKAIDKAAGVDRAVVGFAPRPDGTDRPNASEWAEGMGYMGNAASARVVTAPATSTAARWQGWGTALKPAFEPIVVGRKPLAGTVAGNVQEHGTGALNIDGCRVSGSPSILKPYTRGTTNTIYNGTKGGPDAMLGAGTQVNYVQPDGGRWPPNVVLTHAATPDGVDVCGEGCVPGCPVRELDEQSGIRPAGSPKTGLEPMAAAYSGELYGASARAGVAFAGYGDTGGASRFFPVFRFEAKAPAAERPRVDGVAHPTVKPLALMRWLVRLVTPPDGVVLDPFLGSGTTAQAARAEGFQCIGIERDETYLPLIRARLDGTTPDLFGGAA